MRIVSVSKRLLFAALSSIPLSVSVSAKNLRHGCNTRRSDSSSGFSSRKKESGIPNPSWSTIRNSSSRVSVHVPVRAVPERVVNREIQKHPVERRVVPCDLLDMSSQLWSVGDFLKRLQICCMGEDVDTCEKGIRRCDVFDCFAC